MAEQPTTPQVSSITDIPAKYKEKLTKRSCFYDFKSVGNLGLADKNRAGNSSAKRKSNAVTAIIALTVGHQRFKNENLLL